MDERQKQQYFLGQAINRNDAFWEDYTIYTDAMSELESCYEICCPYILPLADAIALYISDEPMWLLADEYYEQYRIVEVGASIPEGFDLVTTVQPKADNAVTGHPEDYFINAVRYTVPVDKEAVVASGLVDEKFADVIVDEVVFSLPSYYMSRGSLMMYDLIANNNWSRPISFTSPHSLEELGIQDYVRLDGYSYTFVPIYTKYDRYSVNVGCLDIDKLYPLFMDECEPGALNQAYRFGNVADEDVLADYFVRQNIESTNIRVHFIRVANGFIARGMALLEPLENGVDMLNSEDIEFYFEDVLDSANSGDRHVWNYVANYYNDILANSNGGGMLTSDDVSKIVNEALANFEKAEKLVARGLEQLPPRKLGYRYNSVMHYIKGYYRIGGELLKLGNMECVDSAMSKTINNRANSLLTKGDDLNVVYAKYHAEWVNYYLEYLDREMFDSDIAIKLSMSFESLGEGLNAAYYADSYDVVSKIAFDFEGLANKYLHRLTGALPEGLKDAVAVAVEKMSESKGGFVYDYVSEEFKPLAICLDNLCYYVYDMQGLPLDTICGDSFTSLMVNSGFASAFGLPLDVEQTQTTSAAPAQTNASKYELSKEVQDIVATYGKGMESWKRATDYAKTFVNAAASRLGVKVNVAYEDDFQYFYAYSDYAEQLVSMAYSKGVAIEDLMESLVLSDEAYVLADEYLKMGDSRAMEHIAYCYDDMLEALNRMERGEYSVADATVVHVNMQEIVDVLNISLTEAGSFDWVANPVVDTSLGYNTVSFDALASKFFRIALNMADAAGVEESANMLTANVAVSIYSLVPSARFGVNGEYDATYVANMRKYLEHPKIAALVKQMYQ